MAFETLLALAGFALVASATPGPNTLMLLASGVNFGFTRTMPHIFGIMVGFSGLLFATGLGLGSLLLAVPTMHLALKIAGACYLLYLAYRIASSSSVGQSNGKERPMTLLEASAFQWVNPKAWMMGVTAMAIYVDPANVWQTIATVIIAFVLVGLPATVLWTVVGTSLRRLLSDAKRLRIFNVSMGVLLALTVMPLIS